MSASSNCHFRQGLKINCQTDIDLISSSRNWATTKMMNLKEFNQCFNSSQRTNIEEGQDGKFIPNDRRFVAKGRKRLVFKGIPEIL